MNYITLTVYWVIFYLGILIAVPKFFEGFFIVYVEKKNDQYVISEKKIRIFLFLIFALSSIISTLIIMLTCINEFTLIPEKIVLEKHYMSIIIILSMLFIDIILNIKKFFSTIKIGPKRGVFNDYDEYYIGGYKLPIIIMIEQFFLLLSVLSVMGCFAIDNYSFSELIWKISIVLLFIIKIVENIFKNEVIRKYDGLAMYYISGKKGYGFNFEIIENNGITEFWIDNNCIARRRR